MKQKINRTVPISFARELRKKQTPSEKIMWRILRNRQFLGFKFYGNIQSSLISLIIKLVFTLLTFIVLKKN